VGGPGRGDVGRLLRRRHPHRRHLHHRPPSLTAIIVREEARLRERHAERIDALLASLPEDRRGAARVLAGAPAEAVVSASTGYELLIVATHGRRGLAHLWLGSVAEKIVRASPVPVLVLHLGPAS
jgi:universal stress protein A